MEFKGQSDLEELSVLLKNESPRCIAIVLASFFDEILARLLGDTCERSFFARIEDASAWGLLSQHEHDDLQTLRTLRNSFAHNLRVKEFDQASSAKVAGLKLWSTASAALPLGRVITTTAHQLIYVMGVIGFRLQRRSKASTKTGPLAEPPITNTLEWPPVTST